jgi:amino acid permease
MATSFFAYSGTELIGISAREAENPKESIPAAIKSTFWRITLFYTITIFLIGLLVPQTALELDDKDVFSSPFVLAMGYLNIPQAADFINGIIIVAILSAANSCMFATSRTLQGLALRNHAPSFFKQTLSGVPVRQILVSALIACIALIAQLPGGNKLLEILLGMIGSQVMITYLLVSVIHLRFRAAMDFHGLGRETLAYVAPGPFGQWFSIVSLALMLLYTFVVPIWKYDFTWLEGISTFGGIFFYVSLYLFYKVFRTSKLVQLQDIDLFQDRSL